MKFLLKAREGQDRRTCSPISVVNRMGNGERRVAENINPDLFFLPLSFSGANNSPDRFAATGERAAAAAGDRTRVLPPPGAKVRGGKENKVFLFWREEGIWEFVLP